MTKKYLIGLDDGHGMETAGKRTPTLKEDLKFRGKTYKKGSIIHENEFNKNLMELLEKELDRCGIGHMQLAPGDTDVTLQNRVKTANNNKCDLVVSCHANAITGSWQERAYGLVVIHHKNCQAKSKTLANNCYKYLSKDVKWYSNGATKYGVKSDTDISGYSLYILKNTSMPAILIEYGFMDNWEDVKVMCSDEFQKACAIATAKGICDTLGIKYVEENTNTSTNITTSTSNASTNVKNLQTALNKSYNCKLDVDGLYGPKTQAAVKKYYLKRGNKNEHVKWLQQVLKNIGYTLGIDGSYGPETERVVKQFQKDKGIAQDGYAGLDTHTKIINSLK